MSTRQCPHCSATGRCQCEECMIAARGMNYARQHRMNRRSLELFVTGVEMKEPSLLALLFMPRALAAASQADESYSCVVCRGLGHNYVGPG